jgi:hypothetical protein
MLAHLEHPRHDHVAQVLVDGRDAIDGRDLAREPIRHVLALQGTPEQRLQPAP